MFYTTCKRDYCYKLDKNIYRVIIIRIRIEVCTAIFNSIYFILDKLCWNNQCSNVQKFCVLCREPLRDLAPTQSKQRAGSSSQFCLFSWVFTVTHFIPQPFKSSFKSCCSIWFSFVYLAFGMWLLLLLLHTTIIYYLY